MNVRAISLPIPLAAPVTIATWSLRRMILLLAGSAQIVVNDLAQAEGEVGKDVHGRNDLQHWKFGDGSEGMRGTKVPNMRGTKVPKCRRRFRSAFPQVNFLCRHGRDRTASATP